MAEQTAEGYKETILKNLQDTIALLSPNQPPYHLLKESIQTTQKILDHKGGDRPPIEKSSLSD